MTRGQAAHKLITANRCSPPCPELSARRAAQQPLLADPMGSAAGGRHRAAGGRRRALSAVLIGARSARCRLTCSGPWKQILQMGPAPPGWLPLPLSLLHTERVSGSSSAAAPASPPEPPLSPSTEGSPLASPATAGSSSGTPGSRCGSPACGTPLPAAPLMSGAARTRGGESRARRGRPAGCEWPGRWPGAAASLPSSLHRAPAAGSGAAPAACACVCVAVCEAGGAGREEAPSASGDRYPAGAPRLWGGSLWKPPGQPGDLGELGCATERLGEHSTGVPRGRAVGYQVSCGWLIIFSSSFFL